MLHRLFLGSPCCRMVAFLLLWRLLVLLIARHLEGLGEVDFLGCLHHGVLHGLLGGCFGHGRVSSFCCRGFALLGGRKLLLDVVGCR